MRAPPTNRRLNPRNAIGVTTAKPATVRIGPLRSSNAFHPDRSAAYQMASTTKATVSAAKTGAARSGRAQPSQARVTVGTSQAAISPAPSNPPGSDNVSPAMNSAMKPPTTHVNTSAVRLRNRARDVAS